MASKQLQGLTESFRAAGPYGGDLLSMRKMMERAPAYPKPDDIAWEPVDATGVPAEWVTPDDCDPGRVVVYVHGGGYVAGSAEVFRSLSSHLARAARARVLSVDYRLAPEHVFPAALDDVVTALGFVTSSGCAPDHLALVGDSSGGGLVLGALIALRDQGDPLPAAAACICPFTDLSLSGASIQANAETDLMVQAGNLASMVEAYLGGHDPRDPAASPLFADLAGLPPLLVQVGAGELLADDSRRLAEKASAAGVEVHLEVWDDVFHVWHSFADLLPEGRDALASIGAHIDQHLNTAT